MGNSKTLSLDPVTGLHSRIQFGKNLRIILFAMKVSIRFLNILGKFHAQGHMSYSVVVGLRVPSPSMPLETNTSQAMDGAISNCCKQRD